MKALRFNQYGGPDVLHFADVEPPRPGPGEIRIAVRCAGVNPSDWKRLEGQYREFEPIDFPAGLGVEASGVIDAVGEGVEAAKIGDAVFGFCEGAVAEYAVLTHWAPKPGSVSFETAAGLPVIVETARRALDELDVKRGGTLLAVGAAGGIGSAVAQWARLDGVEMIGAASEAKHDYLRSLGVRPTTYGPGLAERVRSLAPHGVDAALDLAGSGVIPELIAIVGDPARVLSVADFSAESFGAKFSHGPPSDPARVLGAAARLCAEGKFGLRIDQIFPLDRVAEAYVVSARGRVTGKLVIRVA